MSKNSKINQDLRELIHMEEELDLLILTGLRYVSLCQKNMQELNKRMKEAVNHMLKLNAKKKTYYEKIKDKI